MTSPILVTGGTGTLGRLVAQRLRNAGSNVRVLTRRSHKSGDGIEFMVGDLATGEGIGPAVDGVETIVHLAGSAKGDEDKARNLVRAASRAGVQHLVYISVVGAERIPVDSLVDRAMCGYFASKLAAKKVIEDSGPRRLAGWSPGLMRSGEQKRRSTRRTSTTPTTRRYHSSPTRYS